MVYLEFDAKRILANSTENEKKALVEGVLTIIPFIKSPKSLRSLAKCFGMYEEILAAIMENPKTPVNLCEEIAVCSFASVRKVIYSNSRIPVYIKKKAFDVEDNVANLRLIVESSFCTEPMYKSIVKCFVAKNVNRKSSNNFNEEMSALARALINSKHALVRNKKEVEDTWDITKMGYK